LQQVTGLLAPWIALALSPVNWAGSNLIRLIQQLTFQRAAGLQLSPMLRQLSGWLLDMF